jgi:hypothetical protein
VRWLAFGGLASLIAASLDWTSWSRPRSTIELTCEDFKMGGLVFEGWMIIFRIIFIPLALVLNFPVIFILFAIFIFSKMFSSLSLLFGVSL